MLVRQYHRGDGPVPRYARLRSESGIYHIMWRGVNRQKIFLHDDDRIGFLEKLSAVKSRTDLQIYAYCLMSNHVHLLVKEQAEPLGTTMKRLGTSYVQWYNQRHDRVGHLFQGRYVSEPVEDERYLLAATRYIHQNPIKAGLSRNCGTYPWSSFPAYKSGQEICTGTTDVQFILEIAGGRQALISYHEQLGDEEFLDIESVSRVSDAELREIIEEMLGGVSLSVRDMNPQARDQVLYQAKAIPGTSLRQIARIAGFSKSAVERARLME